MENPIKKQSLIPKMFRAFTVYFFITLAVFFGYVELFGGVKTIMGSLPDSAQGEVDMSFSNFLTNMMSLQNIYVEDVQLKFVGGGTSVSVNANIAMDLATNQVSVEAKVDVNGHLYNVGVVYCQPEVYFSIDDKTYKFQTASLDGDLDFGSVIKIFSDISKNLGFDFDVIAKIEEALGIDFSNLNMASIMDQLDISTKKSNGEVKISIHALNFVEAMITCDENCFMKSASIKGINIGANSLTVTIPTVEMNDLSVLDKIQTPSEENIIDLTGINDYVTYAENLFANDCVEVDVLVDVSGKCYSAKLNIDNCDGLKFKVETAVEGYDISLVYADEVVYVDVNDFAVSFAIKDFVIWKDKILTIIEEKTSKSVGELIEELLEKYFSKENEADFVESIKQYLNKLLSCSENLGTILPISSTMLEDKFVLNWNGGIELSLSKIGESLSGLNFVSKDVLVDVDFKAVEQRVEIPDNYEDLSPIFAKVENLLNYVEAGIFEFDFDANYNGLDFVGKFKYANGVFEISNVLMAGEFANIRIENGFVYFSYGNMKLKFVLPENDGSFESVNFKEMLAKLTSENLGVEINFGVFEELLNMIANYSKEDWMTKLVLKLGGNQNDINLTISNKNQLSLSEILKINVTFSNDKLDTAKISVYDILSAQIKIDYVEESTIKPFDPEQYKEYSEDFVAGALDSLEVAPNVYGFSSDIAIRYSKTTFYGEIVAMLVKNESHPASIGGFLPAVSIHTTSLGLDSFVYMIGQTLYIDVNGLQVSADLNTTTINEVLEFVESKFGISLGKEAIALSKTAETFKVVLPAIDKIYGSWISEFDNGIQININDGLWYGKDSRFEDIVIQAFITNHNNTILPTKFVIGANIYDPNTLVYDDYSDAWLDAGKDENGDKIIIEDAVTQNLNFGAYFTNVSAGIFAESIDRVFAIENKNYQNITSVMSNYGISDLSEFNSYKTALTLAETVYDYGMSMQYQVSFDGSICDENSQIDLGGDVVVAVADLEDGQTAELDLFGGKSLKVQGNFDVGLNGIEHLLDLLYSNVDEGMYLTYTHGANIEKGNKFKAKIANTNMSEIISMIVKFANLDLGDGMKEAWNIGYCTTDFSYLQSLMGIEKTEVGDTISKADITLDSIQNITKMLGLIKLDKVVGENGLNDITLSVQLKLDENQSPANITLLLKEELIDDVVVTKLRQIAVSELAFGGKLVNMTINVQDFSEESFDYDTSAQHIDFSNVSKLIDTIVTSANTKNFTFNGDMALNLGGVAKIDMALDLFISLEDIKNPYVFAQVELNTNAIADMVFNGSFDKRLITYEYKNGVLEFHRFSKKKTYDSGLLWRPWEKVVEDGVSRNSYGKGEIVSNITPIILDSLGMKESFMGINLPNMIVNIIKNINVNPTLEEALIGFETDEECTNTVIMINGANILGDGAENINLNLGATKYKGYTYNDKGEIVDKTFSCIDSITGLKIKMTGVDISLNLRSKNDVDSYQTTSYELKSSYKGEVEGICGGRTLYTNRYYQTRYINTVGGIYA